MKHEKAKLRKERRGRLQESFAGSTKESTMGIKLERDVRFLKIYAVTTTVGLGVLFLTAFHSTRARKFDEIDAERINIIEPDGKLDMVITDKSHFPPPVWKGKPMEVGRKGEVGQGLPGLVFYNTEGTEAGGLAFTGSSQDGKLQAGAGLIFDQYDQDQIVAIDYNEGNDGRAAGLHVWERPDTPLIDLVRKQQSIGHMPEGAAKQAALKQFREQAARGEFGGQTRVFVGKNEKDASEVTLADAQGKPRIRFTVQGNGHSSLEFLNEEGKTIYSLPPSPGK